MQAAPTRTGLAQVSQLVNQLGLFGCSDPSQGEVAV